MKDKTNTARQRKYRSLHRRFDYVPYPDALAVIEKHIGELDRCYAGVIDRLILEGDKHLPCSKEHGVTGNS